MLSTVLKLFGLGVVFGAAAGGPNPAASLMVSCMSLITGFLIGMLVNGLLIQDPSTGKPIGLGRGALVTLVYDLLVIAIALLIMVPFVLVFGRGMFR